MDAVPKAQDITSLLIKHGKGDPRAFDALVPLVYRELRQMANRYMRRESKAQTLQATALVHEAYLRLVDQTQVEWQNRSHFFAIAAQTMRRILIEQARRRLSDKRGGDAPHVPLEDIQLWASEDPESVLALDQALVRLAAIDERKVKVVELKYFVGMSLEEVAEVQSMSLATVKRDWDFAKAYLAKELLGR